MLTERLFVWVTLLLQLPHGWCVCYFPGELQGVWETQVTSGQDSRPPITYQEITIHTDIIVQWGSCHARIDNYIILTDRTGSTVCFRCIQMDVVSPQVMQVWSTGMQTCYLSEEAALRTCPASADVASRRAVQTMLYKTKTVWGEKEVGTVECPFNGRYTFTYRRGPASNGVAAGSCDQPTSQFSNCPYGFAYNVIYRDCSFPAPQPRGLQCLGSWVGEDRKDYLAVWDSSVKEDDVAVPRYKCGMFLEEAGTGRVLLSFSEDSTCTNNLNSPTDGYENYVLMSVPSLPLPPDVSASTCTFPGTLSGHWHHTFIAGDTIVFKDYRNHKTYSASCVKDLLDGERFIVYARTHCGDWNYNCLWLKRRSANVLEFMLGLYPRENFDVSLCDVGKFGDMTSWITQGKSLLEEPTTCPIVGNYAGELPDAPGYCAQLYSDCETPQLMYYTVGDCRNTSNVYEQREYQCLGQWEEEGRLYALTYRRDIRIYECFVGVIKPQGVVFIKEAGSHCSRGIRPEVLGMKLHRKESCTVDSTPSQASPSSQRSSSSSSRAPVTKPPWLRTTRSWKPITGRPSHRGSGSATLLTPSLVLIFTITAALIASTVRIV